MNIQTIRQIIRQESPSHIMDGTVISSDPRGTRTATVRETGGHVHSRVYTCTEDIGVGDKVIIARLEGLDRLVVLGKIASSQGSSLSNKGVLAPPTNFSVLAYPAMVYAQWDTYPGEDLSWEIQYSLTGSPYADAAQVLVSRGSYYLYPCDPGTTVYMRARAIRWLGDNNLQYSAWCSWASTSAAEYEVPNLIIDLTNKSGGARIATEVVIVDTTTDNSFDTTTTAGDTGVVGVVMENIADDAVGQVCISGYCQILIDNAVTRGDYLQASATEGRADGVAVRSAGSFARALESGVQDDAIWAIISLGMAAGSGFTPAPANEGEALVATAALAWTASLTPTWLGEHSFGAGMAFVGASGANEIVIPNNTAIALELLDTGGTEYLRIVSTTGGKVTRFNDEASGIDFEVRAFGVADALQVQGSDGQITLGALTAGFVKSSAGGVLSVATEVALAELASYAQGAMIRGGIVDWETFNAGGAGYALVSTGIAPGFSQTPTWTGEHSFEAGMAFTGASGANEITIPAPAAIALELLDTNATEYLRINTVVANPYFLIDPAAAGINVGIGKTAPTYGLDVAASFQADKTDTSTVGTINIHNIVGRVNPGAASNAKYIGLKLLAATNTASAANVINAQIIGSLYQALHRGTSNLASMEAHELSYGNTSSGTITNAYGLRINSAINSGGGAITNNYTLYIANQTVGGTNYAIYSAGGASYHAGNIGIGMVPTANGLLCMGTPTENTEFIDAGSAGATAQDWIEVEIGGVQGYIHVFAAK